MFNRPKIEMQGITSCSVSHGLTLSAGVAGDILEVQLPELPILNSSGGQLASYTDTSLSWGGGTTLTNEVAPNTEDDDLSNGDYWVDYTTGYVRGKRADAAGNETASYTALVVKIAESYKPVAEDNINGVLAFVDKKIAANDHVADFDKDFGANVTANIKASAGNLYAIWGDNDNASVRYLQLHDTAGTPAGAAVPKTEIAVPAGGVLLLGEDILGLSGLAFSNGIAYAWSTTSGSYTAATATDHITSYRYK